jgi:glycosyltransferase involved in cell wall biosynthesis
VTVLVGASAEAEAQRPRFKVLCHGHDPVDPARFEHRLYNIGNQPFHHGYVYDCALRWPGAVILHDVVLYYLVVGYYQARNDLYAKVYALEGARGVDLIKRRVKRGQALLDFQEPERLPLNAEVVATSRRVVVHSQHAYDQLVRRHGPLAKLARIDMVVPADDGSPVVPRGALCERYGIPADRVLVTSLGFVAPTKQNREVCEVVRVVNGRLGGRICYVMVGDGSYADDLLGDGIVRTGYVGEEELRSFIAHSDLVVNLRYPSMGETSASLLRALSAGRPCVVNDVGWFAELPREVVIRVDHRRVRDELARVLIDWIEGRLATPAAGKAVAHIETHHAPDVIARKLEALLGR